MMHRCEAMEKCQDVDRFNLCGFFSLVVHTTVNIIEVNYLLEISHGIFSDIRLMSTEFDWKHGSPHGILTEFCSFMGVSKNRGTPKWMVYNGKPY